MDFFVEDMGRVAKLCVTENETVLKGVTPMRIGNVAVAVVGKAKIVICHYATMDELKHLLQCSETSTSIKDAWVLVVKGEFYENFAEWVHPYIVIVNGGVLKASRETYEQYSRGWIVEDTNGTHTHKKVLYVGNDDCVDVLFGESRENPVGLLSIKCMKK